MLPPEDLPLARDANAEVVICRRPGACQIRCVSLPILFKVGPENKCSVEEIQNAIGQLN